jgi:2-aminoethylphosphonate-pyruvate transaminase
MARPEFPENPYLLLTPGPLSSSQTVKSAMLQDWCTWDRDYNSMVQEIRAELVSLATSNLDCTAVLMQGSGTFCVESVIGTALGKEDKFLVLANGAYGSRMAEIARYLDIALTVIDFGETGAIDPRQIEAALQDDRAITTVAVVHCETTTGRLNDIVAIGKLVKSFDKTYIVDAMSSFGGMAMSMEEMQADYLVSSANKCIQGVPGFGFVIARREAIESTAGQARSLSLDMYEQWRTMERDQGKWRFTSATHVVHAFSQALKELREEGGIAARAARYSENQRLLVDGMRKLGFECLLPDDCQSPIITAFISPQHPGYRFEEFYLALKDRGFVIYPGNVTEVDTFRIGNIGEVYADDIHRLLKVVAELQ